MDKRKQRKVSLHHWSWSYLLAAAVMQKEHRGVSDPEQAWILGELIRYLEHPRSGALELDDMGGGWVPVRQAITTGTLRASDKCAPEVAGRFDALLRYASLRLGRRLGIDVTQVLNRREQSDPAVRTQNLVTHMVENGILEGAVRIPDAIGNVHIVADMRAGQITCHVDIDAPRQGRPQTRVNWLVRQLKAAPDSVRIEAFVANSRGAGATELLGRVRADPTVLVTDPAKEIRRFRVEMSAQMGTKRGRGRGAFIDSVIDLLDTFYGDVVQNLKAWAAAPPKLREEKVEPEQPVDVTSTALSSQDGPESGGPSSDAAATQ